MSRPKSAAVEREELSFRRLMRTNINLRLLFAAQFASLSGTQISRVVIPTLAVLTVHVSAAQAAAIVIAEYVPAVVLSPIIGSLADKLPARSVLVGCDIGRALCLLTFVAYLILSHATFAGLIALSLLIGVASVMFDVTATTVVPSLFDDDRRITATAGLVSSQYVTQIMGPTVGGAVVQFVGTTFGLVADAVSYLISLSLLSRLSLPAREKADHATEAGRREVFRGFKLVLSDRYLRRLIIGMALLNLGGSGAGALFALYLYRNLGFHPSLVGLCFAINGIGMVAGARAGARLIRRFREAVVIRASSSLCAIAVVLIPAANYLPSVACIFTYQALFGFGASLWALSVSTSIQRVVALEVIGRVNASLRAVVMSTFPIGAALAGALATRFGVLSAMELLVAFVVVTPLVYLTKAFRAGVVTEVGGS